MDELLKGGITLLINVLTIVGALLVGRFFGNRITVMWNIRQKRRELQLSLVNQFYELYGEFFAVWKLWNYSKSDSNVVGLVHDEDKLTPEQMRWDLYQRACKADGQVEAMLVKVASERVFENYDRGDSEIETLCKFRQAYRTLRGTIRNDQILNWKGASHPPYRAFKCVAAHVACILNSADVKREGLTGKSHYQPEEKEARKALELITSHDWHKSWEALNDKPLASAHADRAKTDAKEWCRDIDS